MRHARTGFWAKRFPRSGCLRSSSQKYLSQLRCVSTYESGATGPSAGVGYTRVSTVSQTLDQQDDALAKAGVAKTFSDNMSGARDDRPGLAALMEYVRDGDMVVVWKLDRPGRNALHIWRPSRPSPTVV
jgi:hypothetical protein